jgi:hypothetical protein
MEENQISWRALEYKRKEKTADWYWAVILIALSIIIASIFTQNLLFAVLVLISTFILISFSINPPKVLNISIDQKGIKVGSENYPYVSLESFWIDVTDEENQKILLKSKKTFKPFIVIPLEEYDHLDVREILLNFLTEEEMHEPVSQKIMDKLGF